MDNYSGSNSAADAADPIGDWWMEVSPGTECRYYKGWLITKTDLQKSRYGQLEVFRYRAAKPGQTAFATEDWQRMKEKIDSMDQLKLF